MRVTVHHVAGREALEHFEKLAPVADRPLARVRARGPQKIAFDASNMRMNILAGRSSTSSANVQKTSRVMKQILCTFGSVSSHSDARAEFARSRNIACGRGWGMKVYIRIASNLLKIAASSGECGFKDVEPLLTADRSAHSGWYD